MKFYDAIYELAARQGVSIENLSLRIGRGPRYVGGAKSRGSLPKVDNAAMILDGLDYVLCAVPIDKVPDDGIVIDS